MARWAGSCLVAVTLWAGAALAQGVDGPPATLIADQIRFDRASQSITASGAVEVFFEGTSLRASEIRFSGSDSNLSVTGPITLTDEAGRVIILADFAQTSRDLQNGVLRSARLVLDREVQIAATEISRTDGRYTQAYQAVASSCQVCASHPTPLWEIRARRIVHDQEAQLIWFERAQFRVAGVPVAYFPRLRLPDPTLQRARGFLVPDFYSNDTIGTGIRVPYFLPLGPHRDLTFTPYVSLEGNNGLGLAYRQAFARGWLNVAGQVSFDDLTNDNQRGYLFADSLIRLNGGYDLDLQLNLTSDRGYLTTYGISDADTLESHAIVSRTRRDNYIEAGFTQYQSLRDGDDNDLLPNSIFDAVWTRLYDFEGGLGGRGRLSFGAHSHARADSGDITGRDVSWAYTDIAWRRDDVLAGGLLFAVEAELYGDVTFVDQDSRFETVETRLAPALGVELSWPLARLDRRGASHLIQPTIQLAWSADGGANVPNDDSANAGFDEANLFDLNRFPGQARREDGARLAFGVAYTRQDPLGWSLGVTLGRVYRVDPEAQFTASSGLDGDRSDWLAALHLSLDRDLTLINRALFDDDFALTSNETAFRWSGERHTLNSNVTWLSADPAGGRPEDTAEFFIEGSYALDQGWSAAADWRYDFAADESTRAGLGVSYANECVDVELSVSRRFTSSNTLEPSTDFGLRVALTGFGGTQGGTASSRRCGL
ncbi:MAG: LPS assembly protein LptD [Pseudomonadota bacterium]